MIRVTIWNEFRHEKTKENVKEIYSKEIGYEPSFYEVLVSGGTREI